MLRRVVVLVDFVNGEVSGVDGGFEVGFEGRVDLAQFLPDDTAEKRMGFDFQGAVFAAGRAEPVVHVAEEPVGRFISLKA